MSATKLVQVFCLIDIAVTGWLALPGLSQYLFTLVYWLDTQLGFATVAPDFAPVHWLMINLAGGLGVLWNTARLLDPSWRLHRVDAWARLWVGGLIAAYVVGGGVTPVLLAFVATEVLGSACFFASRRRV
mgnify:FL=1